MDYTSNFRHIHAQIAESKRLYNRSCPIEVIAVSKYQSIEQIKALHKCGQVAFGENKVQDLKIKYSALESLHLQWHFIGTLQENKINTIASHHGCFLDALIIFSFENNDEKINFKDFIRFFSFLSYNTMK